MKLKTLALVCLSWFLASLGFGSEKDATEYCAGLKTRDKSQESCVKFVTDNQVSRSVLDLCASGFKDPEHQFRCVRSGAEKEDLQKCLALRWNEENLLSCLVYGNNSQRLDACVAFSRIEENEVKCLKAGRHPSQVLACATFSSDEQQKLDCLGSDTPAYAVKDCKRVGKTEVARLKCLQVFVDPNLRP